jgi:hypothetical protein
MVVCKSVVFVKIDTKSSRTQEFIVNHFKNTPSSPRHGTHPRITSIIIVFKAIIVFPNNLNSRRIQHLQQDYIMSMTMDRYRNIVDVIRKSP